MLATALARGRAGYRLSALSAVNGLLTKPEQPEGLWLDEGVPRRAVGFAWMPALWSARSGRRARPLSR